MFKTYKKIVLMVASCCALVTSACGGCGGGNAAPNNIQNNSVNADMGENSMACPAGSPMCPCKAGDVCDTGLICSASKCVEMSSSGLSVEPESARACELVLEEGATVVLDATGTEQVKVAYKRRAPRVAVSFMSTSDTSIPAGAVALQTDGASDGFAIDSVRCFDADGAVIDGARISLD